MSARLVGMADLTRILAELPEKLERNVLRGAMKAGAEVIAEDARDRCRSDEVRETIVTSAKTSGRVVTALIQTKGDGSYKAPWLEYGTAAHIIRADEPEGRTVRRLNRLNKKGLLMIGGNYVGSMVWHPGASERPFMRPALDQNEGKAVDVIGAQIAARLPKINEVTLADGDGE